MDNLMQLLIAITPALPTGKDQPCQRSIDKTARQPAACKLLTSQLQFMRLKEASSAPSAPFCLLRHKVQAASYQPFLAYTSLAALQTRHYLPFCPSCKSIFGLWKDVFDNRYMSITLYRYKEIVRALTYLLNMV